MQHISENIELVQYALNYSLEFSSRSPVEFVPLRIISWIQEKQALVDSGKDSSLLPGHPLPASSFSLSNLYNLFTQQVQGFLKLQCKCGITITLLCGSVSLDLSRFDPKLIIVFLFNVMFLCRDCFSARTFRASTMSLVI
jgi:hypothetical protein